MKRSRHCPACGEPVNSAAASCGLCGADLDVRPTRAWHPLPAPRLLWSRRLNRWRRAAQSARWTDR